MISVVMSHRITELRYEASSLVEIDAAAAARNVAPVAGSCVAPPSTPVWDESCTNTNEGSFTAQSKDIHSVKDCAQHAREMCGNKAQYVSFHPGADDYLTDTGDCRWYSANECPCVEEGTACVEEGQLELQYSTGKISELLAPNDEDSGSGVAPPLEIKDAAGRPINNTEVDPAYVDALTNSVQKRSESPEEKGLGLLASPEEIKDDLIGDTTRAQREALATNRVESECPGRQEALMRGEWQCIVVGGINSTAVIICLSIAIATFGIFTYGAYRMMKKAQEGKTSKRDGEEEEEEDYDLEEEEEEDERSS